MTQVYLVIILVVVFSFLLVQGSSINKLDESQTPFTLTQNNLNITVPSDKQSLQLGFLNIRPPAGSGPACTPGKLGLDFLLDVSSSMDNRNRLPNMREAVKRLAESLQPTDILAGQKFSRDAQEFFGAKFATTDAILEFKNNLDILNAGGGTQTYDGFDVANTSLSTSTKDPEFADHSWSLILVTDGCPNSAETTRNAVSRFKSSLPNVRIITIGVDLAEDNVRCIPLGGYEGAKRLMEEIASTPQDYHDVTSENLVQTITGLKSSFCPGT